MYLLGLGGGREMGNSEVLYKKNLEEIKKRLKEYEEFMPATQPPEPEADSFRPEMAKPEAGKTLLDV
jgi:hypothetical protein